MEEESDNQYLVYHLKNLLLELLKLIRNQKFKGLLLVILLFLQICALLVVVQSFTRLNSQENVLASSSRKVRGQDLPVFTFCSKDQYRDDILQSFGIQSSSSYAMNHDWIGFGEEDPEDIFENSVFKLENIVLDVKIYLDRPNKEGKSIIRSYIQVNFVFFSKECLLKLELT